MKTLKLTLLSIIFVMFAPSIMAANFSFKDINGKRHSLSDYKGKWVLVNYWATYCGPCKMEVSHLNQIKRAYPNDVVVIGLEAGSSSKKDIRKFMNQYGMHFTVAPTQVSVARQPLGAVRKMPTTFIVNPQGNVEKAHPGILRKRDFDPYMQKSAKQVAPQNTPDLAAQQKAKEEEARKAKELAMQKEQQKQAALKQQAQATQQAQQQAQAAQQAAAQQQAQQKAQAAQQQAQAAAQQKAQAAQQAQQQAQAAQQAAAQQQARQQAQQQKQQSAHDFLMSIDLNSL
jgi:thiol-disulfide isomerase/thioredoxin